MRPNIKICFVHCSLLALLAVLAGCGGHQGPEIAVVSGKVTYAGQPVAEGMLRFEPMEGTEGPACAAVIKAGRYEVKARGGVPVGKHRVRIWASRPIAGAKAAPQDLQFSDTEGPPQEQYLPAKYNDKSELEVTIPPKGGKVVRDFDLAR